MPFFRRASSCCRRDVDLVKKSDVGWWRKEKQTKEKIEEEKEN